MTEQGKRNVMVVDDEPDAVEYVTAIMEEAGWEVSSASNGAECLAKLKEMIPNLIVLDVQMPGEPGFYVLQKIKEGERTRGIPVIMLTGVGERLGVDFSSKDMYDFLGHEPDAYLEKPIVPKSLCDAADRLVPV